MDYKKFSCRSMHKHGCTNRMTKHTHTCLLFVQGFCAPVKDKLGLFSVLRLKVPRLLVSSRSLTSYLARHSLVFHNHHGWLTCNMDHISNILICNASSRLHKKLNFAWKFLLVSTVYVPTNFKHKYFHIPNKIN